jgi:hypothetical protein
MPLNAAFLITNNQAKPNHYLLKQEPVHFKGCRQVCIIKQKCEVAAFLG